MCLCQYTACAKERIWGILVLTFVEITGKDEESLWVSPRNEPARVEQGRAAVI